MRIRTFGLVAALAVAPLSLSAQATDCTAVNVTVQDACQKAVDLFQYMAPQVGTLIAGGNATLGQGGTLGGFATFPFPHPKISIGLRVNALAGSLPDLEQVGVAATGRDNSTPIPAENQILPAPAADVSIGVFKGIPLPLTNVGGVDLLLSALYLPELDESGVELELPDGGLKLGYGVRVGLLQESLVTPGISFTWLKRDLPTANLSGSAGAGGTAALAVENLEVGTTSWRVVASKALGFFGVAAGVGQDSYESSADVSATFSAVTSATVRMEQDVKRTNYFLDLSTRLPFLSLIGEVGMVQGGTIQTFNQWDGKQPDDSRLYGSFGARLSF